MKSLLVVGLGLGCLGNIGATVLTAKSPEQQQNPQMVTTIMCSTSPHLNYLELIHLEYSNGGG